MKISVLIERLEKKFAVLETAAGDLFEFPRDLLPENVQEGTMLKITIEEDSDAAKERLERIRNLRQNMLDGNS